MLRDQTTRSKLATREHSGGAGSSRSPSLAAGDQQSGSDCRDSRGRPDRL